MPGTLRTSCDPRAIPGSSSTITATGRRKRAPVLLEQGLGSHWGASEPTARLAAAAQGSLAQCPAWGPSHALVLPQLQDHWSSLPQIRSTVMDRPYWGWDEWMNHGQEAKCFEILNCSDTLPNGSPMFIMRFEVQSASTSNGINFPFNNSSYKPQT